MGYQAKLTSAAQDDLAEIGSFVGQAGPQAEERILNAIADRIDVLEDFPFGGALCRDFAGSDVREIVYAPYRIIYKVYAERQLVYILRVWHGARGKPRLPEKKNSP